MSKSTDIPERTRALVRDREDGRCALCRSEMTDIHHLWPKGMGGSSRPGIHAVSGLIGLCRPCHSWTHGNVAASEAAGWIRPSGAVWLQNVNYAYPGWFSLADDGLVEWVDDGPEPAVLPPGMPSVRSAGPLF